MKKTIALKLFFKATKLIFTLQNKFPRLKNNSVINKMGIKINELILNIYE